MSSPGDRQRQDYFLDRRYGTVRARIYVPWQPRALWRRLGPFAAFGIDPARAAPAALAILTAAQRRALASAWRRAQEQVLAAGPPEEKRAGGPTLEAAAREFFRAAPATRWAAEVERMITKDVLPALGRRPVTALRRGEIAALLDRIAGPPRAAPITARRTFAALRRMLNWARGRDWIEHNPCEGLRPPGRERGRERVLSDAEIAAFWRGCEALPRAAGDALRLVLLTAARPGEVRRMEWSELDAGPPAGAGAAVWTIPAAKAKARRDHRVPLSSLALTLLGARPRAGRYVFPGRQRGRRRAGAPPATDPLDSGTLARAMRRLRLAATPHDLRRTAASHIAAAGAPRALVRRLLAHADREVTAVYDRYSYEPELRRVLEAWAGRLQGLLYPLVASETVA
jgi:integrase